MRKRNTHNWAIVFDRPCWEFDAPRYLSNALLAARTADEYCATCLLAGIEPEYHIEHLRDGAWRWLSEEEWLAIRANTAMAAGQEYMARPLPIEAIYDLDMLGISIERIGTDMFEM